MWSARYYAPGDIRLEQQEKPACAPGQIRVQVAYSGICGSDLHNYRKGMFMTTIPQTMGHEFSGIVEAVGLGVTDFLPGDKVVADPRVGCGTCPWCAEDRINLCPQLGFIGEVAPGSFAEYIVLESCKLMKIPPNVTLKEAALVEPLAVAHHIVTLGGLLKTDRLGIVGAGPIGLLTLMVAKALVGCEVIMIDLNPHRLELAQSLGADSVCRAIDDAEPVDVVVEAVGLGLTLQGCLNWLKPTGKLVMAGLYEDRIDFDPNPIVTKELILRGVDAYGREDLSAALSLLGKGLLQTEQVISHIFPLQEVNQAFALLNTQQKDAAKVLLATGFDPESPLGSASMDKGDATGYERK